MMIHDYGKLGDNCDKQHGLHIKYSIDNDDQLRDLKHN